MEATVIILIFVVTCLLFYLLDRYILNYLAKQQSVTAIPQKTLVASAIGSIICTVFSYWVIYRVHFCGVGCLTVCILMSLALTLLFYHKSQRFSTLSKLSRAFCALTIFALSSIIAMGAFPMCRWIFPDVTTVSNELGKYYVSTRYAWPNSDNFKPTGSYILNNTTDTLYRVVVSYAFLGEETKNHYNITDTIDPMTAARIPCHPNFVARRIYPIMMPSYGKTGRYRTHRSYIVNGGHLDAFESGDFSSLGISENVRVDSFNITSNPIIWEDPERLKALDGVINRFYRRK